MHDPMSSLFIFLMSSGPSVKEFVQTGHGGTQEMYDFPVKYNMILIPDKLLQLINYCPYFH